MVESYFVRFSLSKIVESYSNQWSSRTQWARVASSSKCTSSLDMTDAKHTCESCSLQSQLYEHVASLSRPHISSLILEAACVAPTIARLRRLCAATCLKPCYSHEDASHVPVVEHSWIVIGLWGTMLMSCRGRLSCRPDEGAEFADDECLGGSRLSEVCTAIILLRVSSSDVACIFMNNKS